MIRPAVSRPSTGIVAALALLAALATAGTLIDSGLRRDCKPYAASSASVSRLRGRIVTTGRPHPTKGCQG